MKPPLPLGEAQLGPMELGTPSAPAAWGVLAPLLGCRGGEEAVGSGGSPITTWMLSLRGQSKATTGLQGQTVRCVMGFHLGKGTLCHEGEVLPRGKLKQLWWEVPGHARGSLGISKAQMRPFQTNRDPPEPYREAAPRRSGSVSLPSLAQKRKFLSP